MINKILRLLYFGFFSNQHYKNWRFYTKPVELVLSRSIRKKYVS